MKIAIVNSSEILNHPTQVMSAEYWVNIKAGKLPFTLVDGEYISSTTKNLNKAFYMTEEEAKELNIAYAELRKATELVKQLKEKHKLGE